MLAATVIGFRSFIQSGVSMSERALASPPFPGPGVTPAEQHQRLKPTNYRFIVKCIPYVTPLWPGWKEQGRMRGTGS